jgi:hypothetical protein
MSSPSEPPPGDDDEDPDRRNTANIVALIAVVILAILGYWAFTAIDRQRKLQVCLAEGRRDCLELVSPTK